jgi:hypothetical protein
MAGPSPRVLLPLLMLATGAASAVLGADRSLDAQNYHVYVPLVLTPESGPAGAQVFRAL